MAKKIHPVDSNNLSDLIIEKVAIHAKHYDQYDYEVLIKSLKIADDAYYNDQPIISDADYDNMYRYVQKAVPHHVYFLGVGSDVRGGKVPLPITLGSLDQIYEGEIEDWVNKWGLNHQSLVITDKLDGISALIVYDENGDFQIGFSRGNGIEGQILTPHINRIRSIPKQVSSKIKHVRGELIISKDNWEVMQQIAKTSNGTQYKNSRNCIAGLMNTIKFHPKQVYDLIDFVAYEIKDYYEEDT